MNNKSEKRKFNRFSIDFMLEVAAEDLEGKNFNEKAVLKDISGEGARFITQQAGKYFPGQHLAVAIFLPGTDELNARMRGSATVQRITPSSGSEIDRRYNEMDIAVRMDTQLYFERVNMK